MSILSRLHLEKFSCFPRNKENKTVRNNKVSVLSRYRKSRVQLYMLLFTGLTRLNLAGPL